MNNSPIPENSDSQTLLNKIVLEFMREQKRKRRWRWFSRIMIFALVLFSIIKLSDLSEADKIGGGKPHVGLIDVNGTIFDMESGGADNFAKSLNSAYKNTGLKALIIRINSPGGSPVQADYMYNSLQYYRKKYPEIKIYSVCVDMCASAAYYVAAGTDDIYANPSSMVGSIGVLYNGFGFVDAIQKLGITRRLQTAGANKGFLDPFSPTTPKQKELLQAMLDDVHREFIDKVRKGRGKRLKMNDQIFSGLFWTGTQARELGLIDGFASSGELARDVIKIDQIIDYTNKQSVFEKVTKNLGTAMIDRIPVALGIKPGFQE
ncbi:S49 family peptidase [Legionella spiritensis]|uniref:Signal peptide peptidase n=1 Tax=Legionella spiritensis TaxID=452 RepID=A0A0W0ZA60_LEGSP|nr:S49 family peptidase [Legionella spiritensis]KTD65790.1 signal peptide peptidase [Legionella spiritensis]SNV41322.1 signal peptide peptidase [Legionella spiritensis]